MLYDDGDGIRFGIESREERGVRTLRHGSLGEILVVAKKIAGVFYVRCVELVWHVVIFFCLRELSSYVTATFANARVTNLDAPATKQGRVRGSKQWTRGWPKEVLDNSLFVRLIFVR